MASYNKTNQTGARPFVLKKFKGESPGLAGDDEAEYMRNFRITPDGSLAKRSGYRQICEFGGDIRAIWHGKAEGMERTAVCVGDKLYELDPNTLDGSGYTVTGQIATTEGRALFFFTEGRLCFTDGDAYLCFSGGGWQTVVPYVPVITTNGGYNSTGRSYYPRNMLTRQVKSLYNTDGGVFSYQLTGRVASVDSVTVAGSEYTNYSVHYGERTTVLLNSNPGIHSQNVVEVTYTLKEDGVREKLLSCLCAADYESRGTNTLFLYGGQDRNALFFTECPSGVKNGEYFPADSVVRAGDGRWAVTAAVRQYDRLLIFAEKGVYITEPYDYEGNEGLLRRRFPLYTVNSSLGGIGLESARQAEDEPISVTRDGVYRWKSSIQGERNALLISEKIAPMLESDYLSSAVTFVDQKSKEYWIAAKGVVRVYNYRLNCWYTFDGIDADGFIDIGKVGFWKGSRIYAFDGETEGGDDDGEPILAVYESGYLDFGAPHLKKKLHRLFAVTAKGGSDASVELLPDKGDNVRRYRLDGGSTPRVTRVRTELPRFTFLRWRISDSGRDALTLQSVAFRHSFCSETKGEY